MISLYADEDIPFPLVKALRREGMTVIATKEGISYSGIIVSKKDQLGILLRRLLHLTSILKQEDIKNRIEFLGNW